MKKSIIILILSLTIISCSPHGHIFRSIDNRDSKMQINVYCTLSKKRYQISGIDKNDTVYISLGKMKKSDTYYLTEGDNTKFYSLKIGDSKYHRKILNDTVKVKIVKPDTTTEIFKFLIVKDQYLKN